MVSVRDVLVLTQVPSVGPHRLRQMLTHFGDSAAARTATARQLIEVDGFSRKLAASVAAHLRSSSMRKGEEFASVQLSRINASGGSIVSFWDAKYPDALKRIYDPPLLLFMLGDVRPDDQFAVAIVGTRSPTRYGSGIAERFSGELARRGVCVVSGLARGIDTVAHEAALGGGGRSIAVIGSGVDIVYPPENRKLAQRLARHGAVLSEYTMGTRPDACNFPRRNRIISGLSIGTIVVETDVTGGAMITAASALDQNREIFAVPGLLGANQSHGCHELIKTGRAKLVESVDDVLLELRLPRRFVSGTPEVVRSLPTLTLFEQTVLQVIPSDAIHVDDIATKASMTMSDALVHLLSLEFKGYVKQLPGKLFARLF